MKYNEYIERKHYALVRERGLSARDEAYGGPAFPERYANHEAHGLVEATGLAPGARVLVIGTGTGADACWLADRGYVVTGVDLVPDAIDVARRIAAERKAPVEYFQDDVCNSNRSYGTFDAVSFCLQNIVSDVDRRAAFDSVKRHLRAGGHYLIVCAGCCPKEYNQDYYRDASTGIVYQKAKDGETALDGVTYTGGAAFLPVRRHHVLASLLDELQGHGFTVLHAERRRRVPLRELGVTSAHAGPRGP